MQIAPRVLAVVLLDLLDRFAVGFAELLGQNNLNFGQQIAGRAVFRRNAVPFTRSLAPLEVPGGTLSVTTPFGVGTSTLAPATASPSVTGTRTCR